MKTQRIIDSFEWMVADMTHKADETKGNVEAGSQGGYSSRLQEAIDVLAELKEGLEGQVILNRQFDVNPAESLLDNFRWLSDLIGTLNAKVFSIKPVLLGNILYPAQVEMTFPPKTLRLCNFKMRPSGENLCDVELRLTYKGEGWNVFEGKHIEKYQVGDWIRLEGE